MMNYCCVAIRFTCEQSCKNLILVCNSITDVANLLEVAGTGQGLDASTHVDAPPGPANWHQHGKDSSIAGLQAYIVGSPSAKKAVVMIGDIFGNVLHTHYFAFSCTFFDINPWEITISRRESLLFQIYAKVNIQQLGEGGFNRGTSCIVFFHIILYPYIDFL